LDRYTKKVSHLNQNEAIKLLEKNLKEIDKLKNKKAFSPELESRI
jgi:hypothetical protein